MKNRTYETKEILLPIWITPGSNLNSIVCLPAGISKNEAQFLTDRLRTELFETGKFQVVEREKMNAILDEQGYFISGVFISADYSELAIVNVPAAAQELCG